MTETFDAGKLADELRSLAGEAEALLRSGAGSGTAELQDRAQETVRELKERLTGLEQQLNARAREVDSYVRDNPWQAVAVAGSDLWVVNKDSNSLTEMDTDTGDLIRTIS